jgi:hypothetical protein
MPRVIGLGMGRRLYVAPAAQLGAWMAEFREPCAALIALDGRERNDEELRDLARTLVDAGCVYSVAWGPRAGRMDLIMDLLSIEIVAAGGSEVMTDSFEDSSDPLLEALWYAVFCTYDDEIEMTALVAVADDEFREEIERYLAETDRLREDYSAFDDARVAAEEEAHRRTWLGRLRGELALRR